MGQEALWPSCQQSQHILGQGTLRACRKQAQWRGGTCWPEVAPGESDRNPQDVYLVQDSKKVANNDVSDVKPRNLFCPCASKRLRKAITRLKSSKPMSCCISERFTLVISVLPDSSYPVMHFIVCPHPLVDRLEVIAFTAPDFPSADGNHVDDFSPASMVFIGRSVALFYYLYEIIAVKARHLLTPFGSKNVWSIFGIGHTFFIWI